MPRAIRFFFMHLGTLVGSLFGSNRLRAADILFEAVEPGAPGQVVHGVYMLIVLAASAMRKQTDLGARPKTARDARVGRCPQMESCC